VISDGAEWLSCHATIVAHSRAAVNPPARLSTLPRVPREAQSLARPPVWRDLSEQPTKVGLKLGKPIAEQVRCGGRERERLGHEVIDRSDDGATAGNDYVFWAGELGGSKDRGLVPGRGIPDALPSSSIRTAVPATTAAGDGRPGGLSGRLVTQGRGRWFEADVATHRAGPPGCGSFSGMGLFARAHGIEPQGAARA
jgi:hypothetical protein